MTSILQDSADAFKITFRREIVFYLRQLINDGELVSVTFDAGQQSMVTVLLDVDEESDAVIFDWGADEAVNQFLLKSARTYFIASPQGVRNQFSSSRVWQVSFKGRKAFATAIPTSYIRMQRRDFFRLSLPVTQRRPCYFRAGDAATQWQMSVIDVGLGGVGLESPQPVLPFERGQKIERATIDLGKYGRLDIDMIVRFIGSVARGPKEVGRLGCEFVRLKPAQENDLQRFITQVQRDERAKLG
ncbi:MAG TPA: flagellar brake protein [Rhodocyclaceae bacterium]